MLTQFGQGDMAFRQVMTSITGGAVCMLVLGMAVYMIMKSSKRLKE